MGEKIKNLKIRAKLYVLVGVALIGMLALGGVSFMLMGSLNGQTNIIAQKWMPSNTLADQMNTTVSNLRLYEVRYVTADGDSKMQTYSGKVSQQTTAWILMSPPTAATYLPQKDGSSMRRFSLHGTLTSKWTVSWQAWCSPARRRRRGPSWTVTRGTALMRR